MSVVCSIGSTHPWNAAGLGLDIAVLRDLGVRAVSVVAGVTAQGPDGMRAQLPLPASLIWAQVDALEKAGIGAFRIGALLEAGAVAGVAHILEAHSAIPAVVDPVFVSSDGAIFADGTSVAAYRERLIPRATLLTPNMDEASVLTDLQVRDEAGMIAAAHALGALGARAVLIKGGHMRGDPVDILWENGAIVRFADARITATMRGTGCVLACAIAAHLANGIALGESVARARSFLRAALARAESIGPYSVYR